MKILPAYSVFRVLLLTLFMLPILAVAQDVFPDGTKVPDWFHTIEPTNINTLGKQYKLTDYDALTDSTIVQTEKIQTVIDTAFANGGGVIVVPKGTFLRGALFFK